MDPRTYLLNRFTADREALTLRAEQLRAASGARGAAKPPGPDAATSQHMADACAEVVAMIETVPDSANAAAQIVVLSGMIPTLEAIGAKTHLSPPVRSVYVGAATRIREIGAAELKVQSAPHNGSADSSQERDADIADDHGDDQ
jgi:hypothetical protein